MEGLAVVVVAALAAAVTGAVTAWFVIQRLKPPLARPSPGLTRAPTPPFDSGGRQETHEVSLGPADDPLVRLRPLEAHVRPGPEVELPTSARSAVGGLLQHLPGAFFQGAAASGHVLRLQFSPAVMAGLERGTLDLMPSSSGGVHAIARTADGSIVEQGRLTGQALQGAAVAAALWQIAAMATAQKFLADIDAKLARIQSGVEAIQRWLSNERRGAVEGNLRYLRQAAAAVRAGALSRDDVQALNSQMEDIEREGLQALEATKRDLASALAAIDAVRTAKWWSTEDEAKQLQDACRKTEDLLTIAILLSLQRLAAARIKLSLPVSHASVRSRISEAQEDATEFRERLEELSRLVTSKTRTMGAKLQRRKTDVKHRTSVRHALKRGRDVLLPLAAAAHDAADAIRRDADGRERSCSEPLSLAVEIAPDRREILAVRRIDEAAERVLRLEVS